MVASSRSADFRRQLIAAVQYAGGYALEQWRERSYAVRMKGARDPVTDADMAVEGLLAESLGRLAPGAPFIGEERYRGEEIAEGWVVDPIDGTVNFAAGIPLFAINVAWFDRGMPAVQATYAPAMGELYWSAQGEGAWLNGTPLRVRACDDLRQAVGTTGFPYWLAERSDEQNNVNAMGRILKACRAVRRGGCAALDLAWVAAGRFDFYWEPGLKVWDIAGGTLLAREAGAIVTGYDGQPLRTWFSPILAASPGIHGALVELLQPYDVPEMDLPRMFG